jgi:hypothetical protein
MLPDGRAGSETPDGAAGTATGNDGTAYRLTT